MTASIPVRIRVARGAAALTPWQRAVVDAVVAVDGAIVADDRPDVVIDLAGGAEAGDARFGVWRFGFGDGAPFADGAAGTIARLYRATADPGRAVLLHEGWFAGPGPDGPGTRAVGDRVAPWCAQAIARLAAGDVDAASGPLVETGGCRAPQPPSARPSVGTALADGYARWRRRERWTVGILPLAIADIIGGAPLPEPAWLRGLAAGECFADPFPLDMHDGRVRLLAEEFRCGVQNGCIAELDVQMDGRITGRRRRLAARHHLSYPFVLRDRDAVFCVPESASANRVTATSITGEGSRTVLDGFPAVDSTIVCHDGRWWLFCTRKDGESQTDLYLFFGPSWSGPWTPHPLNPVKSDARSSRPAGAIVALGGSLYRPAQNCARRYGAAVSINRVVTLTPARFGEHVVRTVAPDPAWAWPDGLHTLNAVDGLALVDGLRVER